MFEETIQDDEVRLVAKMHHKSYWWQHPDPKRIVVSVWKVRSGASAGVFASTRSCNALVPMSDGGSRVLASLSDTESNGMLGHARCW